VPNLCRTYSWLAWLCDLPTPVPGIIAGILPPALLALLFLALPVIFRREWPSYLAGSCRALTSPLGPTLVFARYEGVPKSTAVELSLMTRYFAFLVIVRRSSLLTWQDDRLTSSHPASTCSKASSSSPSRVASSCVQSGAQATARLTLPLRHVELASRPRRATGLLCDLPRSQPARSVDLLPHVHHAPRPRGLGRPLCPVQRARHLLHQALCPYKHAACRPPHQVRHALAPVGDRLPRHDAARCHQCACSARPRRAGRTP
jgi:hypothetical protein